MRDGAYFTQSGPGADAMSRRGAYSNGTPSIPGWPMNTGRARLPKSVLESAMVAPPFSPIGMWVTT